MVVANAGPSTARNIVVTDVLPTSVTYTSAEITGGKRANSPKWPTHPLMPLPAPQFKRSDVYWPASPWAMRRCLR